MIGKQYIGLTHVLFPEVISNPLHVQDIFVSEHTQPWVYLLLVSRFYTHTTGMLKPRRDLAPGIPTHPRRDLGPGIPTPLPRTEWQTSVKTLKLQTMMQLKSFCIRDFSKLPKLAIMPILELEALLHENKKNSSNKMLCQWVLNPLTSDSKSNTLLSGIKWHLLVRLRLYAPYIIMLYWF